MTNRIRYLKPDFFLDEDVGALPPLIRLFYAGLWCHADREGRLEDRPQRLTVEIMPYEKGFDAEAALVTLSKPKAGSGRPFIIRYQVDGRRYIQILSWARHQRPHPNEKASEIPSVPRETLAMYDKGQTRVLHKTDKGHTLEYGDGDLNGDGDGDGEGDGECEGEGETKINPPAPIQGSGSAKDAEPSLIKNISHKGKEKKKPKPVVPGSSSFERVPGFNDGELAIIAKVLKDSGPPEAIYFLEKAKRKILPCLEFMLEMM